MVSFGPAESKERCNHEGAVDFPAEQCCPWRRAAGESRFRGAHDRSKVVQGGCVQGGVAPHLVARTCELELDEHQTIDYTHAVLGRVHGVRFWGRTAEAAAVGSAEGSTFGSVGLSAAEFGPAWVMIAKEGVDVDVEGRFDPVHVALADVPDVSVRIYEVQPYVVAGDFGEQDESGVALEVRFPGATEVYGPACTGWRHRARGE